jgi:hypothetical protein
MGEILPDEFIDKLRATAVINAVGASALRNQGAPIIQTVRDFLDQLNSSMFVEADKLHFERRLAEQTEKLLAELPVGCQPWGRPVKR